METVKVTRGGEHGKVGASVAVAEADSVFADSFGPTAEANVHAVPPQNDRRTSGVPAPRGQWGIEPSANVAPSREEREHWATEVYPERVKKVVTLRSSAFGAPRVKWRLRCGPFLADKPPQM